MGFGGSRLAEILKEHERTESAAPRDARHLGFILKAMRTARSFKWTEQRELDLPASGMDA